MMTKSIHKKKAKPSDARGNMAPFGGEGSEALNALFKAFHDCADDDDVDIYKWLEVMPRASMTCNLVNKLKYNGYEIVKVGNVHRNHS